MQRKLFGTDGIRGVANFGKLAPDRIVKIAQATGKVFLRGTHRHLVVIGKDTRLSGYMIEPSLTAGFTSVGMDVVLVGPLPTPAIAMLARSLRADLGVMISASHNLYEDNGLKFFSPDGRKLPDEIELRIEDCLKNFKDEDLVSSADMGRARRLEDAQGRYIEYVKSTFPKGMRLDGLKVVLDCANGACYKIAPMILWELGAEVISIGVSPNGKNINTNCGATSTEAMRSAVIQNRADIGIALDGDGDRCIISDKNGQVIDGDQVLAAIAKAYHERGTLKGGGVVSTIMSNLGLERYLEGLGLKLIRSKVGDRYVYEKMSQYGMNVGGEPSGHIILSDYGTTGDGLVSALMILSTLVLNKKAFGDISCIFTPVPQISVSLKVSDRSVLNKKTVKDVIVEQENFLESYKGRLVVRASGTEPVIRLMVEGEDRGVMQKSLDCLQEIILKEGQ